MSYSSLFLAMVDKIAEEGGPEHMKRKLISPEDAAKRHGIDLDILKSYVALRELPDGRLCGVTRLMFHYTIHVGIDHAGYSRRWCFDETVTAAVLALLTYDGGDEMPGPWRKDVQTGRYQDPETGVIWHEAEPKPKTTGRPLL